MSGRERFELVDEHNKLVREFQDGFEAIGELRKLRPELAPYPDEPFYPPCLYVYDADDVLADVWV